MNPQEKENRAENRDEQRKEKAEKPARLGKEAKIGAAVILVLLVVFVGVVISKLKGSDDKKPNEVANLDAGKLKPPVPSRDGPFMKPKPPGSQPSMVAKSTPPAPPTVAESNRDKWGSYSSKVEPKPSENRYSASPTTPPSFATDLPKPPHASRYDSVASDPDRFGKPLNELRPESSESRLPQRSVATRKDFERSDSSGFASAGDPPMPPVDRGNSRYDDRSAAMKTPLPARDNSSYRGDASRPYSAAPVSKYDDDFPSASTKPLREHHRYDGSSPYGSQPTPRNDGKYEVQPNDSYSKIAEKLYGNSAYFKALAEANRTGIGSDNYLKPGETISTPSVAELEKSYPDLCPKASRRETQELRNSNSMVSSRQSLNKGRTYTVSEGDTLFNIARYELGKASRWAEIYELNRESLGKDFNYLTPGMKLVLPDGEKSDTLTSRPNGQYRK